MNYLLTGNLDNTYEKTNFCTLDLESFIIIVKKMLGKNKHLSLVIDNISDVFIESYRAVNNLLSSRINSDISMNILTEPDAWKSYFAQNGQFVEVIHDYEDVQYDESSTEYIKRMRKKVLYGIIIYFYFKIYYNNLANKGDEIMECKNKEMFVPCFLFGQVESLLVFTDFLIEEKIFLENDIKLVDQGYVLSVPASNYENILVEGHKFFHNNNSITDVKWIDLQSELHEIGFIRMASGDFEYSNDPEEQVKRYSYCFDEFLPQELADYFEKMKKYTGCENIKRRYSIVGQKMDFEANVVGTDFSFESLDDFFQYEGMNEFWDVEIPDSVKNLAPKLIRFKKD